MTEITKKMRHRRVYIEILTSIIDQATKHTPTETCLVIRSDYNCHDQRKSLLFRCKECVRRFVRGLSLGIAQVLSSVHGKRARALAEPITFGAELAPITLFAVRLRLV